MNNKSQQVKNEKVCVCILLSLIWLDKRTNICICRCGLCILCKLWISKEDDELIIWYAWLETMKEQQRFKQCLARIISIFK